MAMQRNITLDFFRTLAISLMVIFHFIYDLKLFAVVDWDIPDGVGWQQFRWVIITVFFLCLGVSLKFAHSQTFKPKKYLTRLLQITAAALIISIGSYVFVPDNWIFFGVLHFIAFSSIVAIPFLKSPKAAFLCGMSIILVGALGLVKTRWPFHILFENLPSYTNDFVGIFPWLGVVLLGISLGYSKWLISDPLYKLSQTLSPKVNTLMSWPGQHSLSIYLLHQPVMVGVLYLLVS